MRGQGALMALLLPAGKMALCLGGCVLLMNKMWHLSIKMLKKM